MAFDWKLIEQTCPGVVRVIPTGMALAVVHVDLSEVMRTSNEVETVPEPFEGTMSPVERAFNEVVDCVAGHGVEIVGRGEGPDGILALRVRRKMLAWLWQRSGLYRQSGGGG